MSWSAAARAFTAAIALSAAAAPALGGSYQGALGRATGAAAASAARAKPAPIAPPHIVTRPMPPFQRAPGKGRHDHRHGPVVVFTQPPFLGPFGYGFGPYFPYYPYSSLYPYSPLYPYSWLHSFGTPPAYPAEPSKNTDPYYCWVDGIGFTDEGRFVHHLHEVHGVPLDEALAATELIGERRVFFGY